MSLSVKKANYLVHQMKNSKQHLEVQEDQWIGIIRYLKKHAKYWDFNSHRSFKVKRNEDLPLSLLVIGRKKPKLLIFFKGESRILGEGGQRIAKQLFDVHRDVCIVYKKPLKIEIELASVLPKVSGLVENYGFYSYIGKSNKKKSILLEKRYDSNMRFLLFKSLKTNELYPIFLKIISALKVMHETQWDDAPCCHFDLKLSNIFCTMKDGKVDQLAIADYGSACRRKHIGGTYHKFSPEYAKFALKRKKFTIEEVIAFHKENGVYIDIFALGLLLSDLPAMKVRSGLNCLTSIFPRSDKCVLKKIASVSQHKIDKELAKFTKRIHSPQRLKLWEVVKGCLRVDPKERISLDRAIAILSE